VGAQQRGEETRSRILEAAQTCFAEDGFDGASVAEICSRAGISKGAFYHHFDTKQQVFSELLGRWLDGLDGQLEALSAGTAPVPQRLVSMAGMVRPVFEVAGEQLPIFLEFMGKAVRDPEVWKVTIAPYRRYRAFFSAMVEEGIAEGSLHQVDAEMAAQVVVSLAVGLVLQGVLDPTGADWGEVAEHGMRILVDGLALGDN
jgi:AcrR family transcriptional regulator